MKITWILATWWPRLTCNHFRLWLGECALFCPLSIHQWIPVSLVNPIPIKLLLRMVNSFHWPTKEIVAWRCFLLVFYLVMELLLKRYKYGICYSPKWKPQLDFIFIPTSVSASMPILTTVLLVDLIQLLSLMFLPFLKFFINQKFLSVDTIIHVPANVLTGQAEVLGVTGRALVLEVLAWPGVPETLAQPPIQHDLHGIFQHRIPNWNSQI